MSAWIKTVLDKLETGFTKALPLKTPFQHWVQTLSPDSSLSPTETYSWSLYFRVSTPPGVGTVLLIAFMLVVVWGTLRYRVPILFTNPYVHKWFIGKLSREGFYWMPAGFLFLLLFNYAIYLPRRYFWNRRAARLRQEPPDLVAAVEPLPPDPSVWPPPPLRESP